MKKTICLVIALLLCVMLPTNSQASDFNKERFSIGILGGINFADMYFPNHQGADAQRITSMSTLAMGAVFSIRLSDKIFARIDPMFLKKGGKIEEGNDPLNQPEGQIKVQTMEIPLLIQYMFGKRIKPYLIAGPSVGYNLKSTIEFEMTGLKFEGDMMEVTKKLDLGLTFGGGVQVPLNFGALFFEGRYTYGLVNQRKSGTATISSNSFTFDLESDEEEDKYTNRGFQLLFGILISI